MFLPILEYLAESFGPLRIFNYFTFRAILATLTSLVFILFFGKTFIRFIAKQKYGQIIRDDGPQSHLEKKGTPTMGGLLILFSIVFSCLCWGDLSNKYLLVSMAVTFLFGVIGLIDDYLKLRYSNSKGLSGRSRLLWEILVALSASSLIYYFATSAEETTLFLPFFKDFALQLGIWFILFSALVLVATANAVNLTDGLDGLAIMPSVMVAAGMGSFWLHSLSRDPQGRPHAPQQLAWWEGELGSVISEVIAVSQQGGPDEQILQVLRARQDMVRRAGRDGRGSANKRNTPHVHSRCFISHISVYSAVW